MGNRIFIRADVDVPLQSGFERPYHDVPRWFIRLLHSILSMTSGSFKSPLPPIFRSHSFIMAAYGYSTHLFRVKNRAFSREFEAGNSAPFVGIYRCAGCGREIAIEKDAPLPGSGHHPHTVEQGSMRWKLLVFADPREK